MDKKRYQVFVSSTYTDLKDARAAVFDTLMKIDCIPAGMELFPAFDEEQFGYIKTIIDDRDYYTLIIAGRYGSITSEGLSFTEKEYDYAVSKGIPVLSFIHSAPDTIPVGNTERDPDKQIRLEALVRRASSGRLVQSWRDTTELSLKVTQALTHAMRVKPGIGWVRGNVAAGVAILSEINELRKANATQKNEIERLKSANNVKINNLAP